MTHSIIANSDSRKRQNDLAPKCSPCQFPRLVGPTNSNTNIGRMIEERRKIIFRARASFLREARTASYGVRINLGRPNDPAAANPPTDKSRCGNWLSDRNSPWRLHPRLVYTCIYMSGAIWSYDAVNPYSLCLTRLSPSLLYPLLVLECTHVQPRLQPNISVFQFRGRHNFATK